MPTNRSQLSQPQATCLTKKRGLKSKRPMTNERGENEASSIKVNCTRMSVFFLSHCFFCHSTTKNLFVTDFFEISRISRFMKGLKSASEVGRSILGHF